MTGLQKLAFASHQLRSFRKRAIARKKISHPSPVGAPNAGTLQVRAEHDRSGACAVGNPDVAPSYLK